MKKFLTAVLLTIIIGNIEAVDIDSPQFLDYILTIQGPQKPEILGDGVVFTAPSSYRRVGISFAHEGYAKVHWFRQLMVPRDPADLHVDGREIKDIDPYIDSGIMFHLQSIPEKAAYLDYRMIIDGLWTVDPLNPLTVTGPSGIAESRVPLPEKPANTAEPAPGTYRFSFRAPSGENVTVGGTFNNWDPFMYELRETSPGLYTLTLPLPPGSFQYVFYYRGEIIPDPENFRRLYNREGRYVSEGVVIGQ